MVKSKLFFLIIMLVYNANIRCLGEEIGKFILYNIGTFIGTVYCTGIIYVPLVGIYTITDFLANSRGNPVVEALKPAQIIGAGGVFLGCLFLVEKEAEGKSMNFWSSIKKDPCTIGIVTGISMASYMVWKIHASLKEKYISRSIQV